ncbi:MAG: SURF1 family protein [Nocardioidaceae bacterium]
MSPSPVIRALAPRFWGAHLLVVLALLVTGWLGLWQFHAWETRRADAAVDVTAKTPIALENAMGPDDPFPGRLVGQPVILDGTWVPEGTVYVEGREHDGQDGVWAVTPLDVGPDHAAMLVVRGWTADSAQAPAPPTGTAELVGWLQPPEGQVITDEDPTDDVLPQVRIADAIQHVDQDLYGAYVVVADKVAPGAWPVGDRASNPGTAGLATASLDQTPEVGRFTALRNLLYALQWWVFGAFALFVWWRHLADTLALESAAAEAAAGPVPAGAPGAPPTK